MARKAPAKAAVKAAKPKLTEKEKYARRIAKGIAEGKSRQQARGKTQGEARIRREREKLRAAGLPVPPPNRPAPVAPSLTDNQRAAVRRFADMQAPRTIGKNASPAEIKAWRREVMAWVERKGFSAFQEFRALHKEAMQQFREQIADGTWESTGMVTLAMWAQLFDFPDLRIGYYH